MAKQKPKRKSPIFNAEPYQNYNASISFGSEIVWAVQHVRQDIALMGRRTEVDEYAPGAIHVLRKLCEGEEKSGHIYEAEVLHWQATVFAWFDRVEKLIPPRLRMAYRANLEDDFRVILAAAGGALVLFSQREADMRYLPVPFESDAALTQARASADKKYPVRLGSALHEYLKACIRKLVEEP